MIFAHCKIIQEGEAALFYAYNRELKGYMIAGFLIAPKVSAKLEFAKIWKYFVSNIVQNDDIYCSVVAGTENTIFDTYLTYHCDLKELKIYKVDNVLKDQYSSYPLRGEGYISG